MIGQGLIQSVHIATAGSYLAADAALAATSLVLESILDFSTDGGQLTLNGVTYTYTAANYDTGTLTLSTGLTGPALTTDRVDVSPLSTEKLAFVTTTGPGDAVSARIPHALVDRVPEGIREPGDEESVQYSLDNGEFVITDVVGRTPVIGAEYVPGINDRFPITETDITDGAISTPKLAADAIDGMTITGSFIRTAATGPRISLNDPAYPNETVFYTNDPDETAPAGIRPVGVGGSSLQLRGPDLTTVASPATFDLSADNSTSESFAELDADRFRLTAATDAIVEGFTATIQGFDGAALVLSLDLGLLKTTADLTADRLTVTAPTTTISGTLDVTGALTKGTVPVVTTTGTQTLSNKDLTSGTNTFPTSLATLTGTQTLTNKDLTSGTNTLPTSVATLTGTQTLTNKDLSATTNVFPATLTPRAVYKTADTTINNSTTLATDPHLQIAGIAAGTYALDALVIYSSSAGVGANWKGFFTATGSITDRLLQVLREPLTGNEYGLFEGAVTFTAAGNGVGVKRTLRIVGTFTATAGGQAFNLQWAQNTAEATNTVVYKGSYYRIQKIA